MGAVLGLLVGVVAACVYLVFKPVQQVKELPKEPSRSVVYFIPGSESNAKGKCWQAKEKQVIGGAGLIFKGSGFYITDYKKKPADKGGASAKPSDSKTSDPKPAVPAAAK